MEILTGGDLLLLSPSPFWGTLGSEVFLRRFCFCMTWCCEFVPVLLRCVGLLADGVGNDDVGVEIWGCFLSMRLSLQL